jgi:hypothetical protein
MKTRLPFLLAGVALLMIAGMFVNRLLLYAPAVKTVSILPDQKVNNEQQARYTEMRAKYDFDMLKNPVTGTIPHGIFEQELAFAKTVPKKEPGGLQRGEALNTYYPAGPNNQGGRTRALAYDIRYNGTSNRVIIAGGVSGGIMRSADGGATWTRVSPDNDIHNVSCIVQDPRPGFQDTWYAGGGEPVGNSTTEIGAVYFGYGIWKSVDNGLTWTNLLSTTTVTDYNGSVIAPGSLDLFDHPFDFIHKLAVNPVNGNLYVCGHRRLLRSTNGGASFQTVFGSSVAATAASGQMDVAISNTGTVILAVNGGNPDLTLRGVWTSTTGNQNSWTRIAGGSTLGTDSVAGWRANSYRFYSGTSTQLPKRILLGMAPSNQNIVYVVYENGLSNTSDNAPEVDMYKLDMTSGNNWTNLSSNMPDFPGSNAATDPFTTQGGYDLCIAVKPDNHNFVLLGGTSLYRSTNGFTSTAGTSWIGGYGNTLPSLTYYTNSHPDIHNVAFNPSNFSEVICANDGGIQITADITATVSPSNPVTWSNINNYQTLQYFHVSMDPGSGRNNFTGGAQDNGTQFRDKMQLVGTAAADSNNHIRILGGDGGHSGMSPLASNVQYIYASYQLGSLRRFKIAANPVTDNITPNGLTTDGTAGEYGEFVTNFLVDPDNTEDMYYANYNRLFRTTSASTVSSSTWTELTGVSAAVNPTNPTAGTNIGIRALAISRGTYITSHTLYIGTTNGKIFRLYNPRNATPATAPVDITPGGVGAGYNVQDIAVNPNNDDEIMAVISNYGVISIWWTNNAKSASPTWRNAEGNLTLPSVRSCAIVVKKDAANNPVTEYYVGTSIGLYSAINIGTTLTGGGSPVWQREGGSVLNYAVVQSIAYRPVDNVMVLGTHGNGMYYTFLGTPNFNPNQSTGVIDPISNDKNFIRSVYPTISRDIVQYSIGNLTTVRKITLQLYSMNGQLIMQNETAYQNGSMDISKMGSGVYILSIYSDNRQYRHLQKIIKQ